MVSHVIRLKPKLLVMATKTSCVVNTAGCLPRLPSSLLLNRNAVLFR